MILSDEVYSDMLNLILLVVEIIEMRFLIYVCVYEMFVIEYVYLFWVE